jgi:hypothetical protein
MRAFSATDGAMSTKVIGFILVLQLVTGGCAVSGLGGSNPNRRGERLAVERGKLAETSNPLARMKSYIVIADLLLSFAADAAREQANDDLGNLLTQYTATVSTARDTVVDSEHQPDRHPQGYKDLEAALGRQLRTLQELRGRTGAAVHTPIDEAIKSASTIREEMVQILSRARA